MSEKALTTNLYEATKTLLQKCSYLGELDKEELMMAFFAMVAFHKDQRRKSGHLYVIHPIQVATTIATYGGDLATLQAALLHDTVEDTEATFEILQDRFGEEVTSLVEAVTHQRMFSNKEFFEKIHTKARKDPRVAWIKIADKIDNTRDGRELVHSPEKHREHLEDAENFYITQLATVPGLPKEMVKLLQKVTAASWEEYNERKR